MTRPARNRTPRRLPCIVCGDALRSRLQPLAYDGGNSRRAIVCNSCRMTHGASLGNANLCEAHLMDVVARSTPGGMKALCAIS